MDCLANLIIPFLILFGQVGASLSGFGFHVCPESRNQWAITDDKIEIFYQTGVDRYSCTIDQAPAFDTVYTCEAESAEGRCLDDDFIQISNRGNNDLAICAVIFNGKSIPVGEDMLLKRDGKEIYKRRYDIVEGGVAIMSVPNDGESITSAIAPQCDPMPIVYESEPNEELIPKRDSEPLFFLDMADMMTFSMDITINSMPARWGNVFHCGDANEVRMPGIWLHPDTDKPGAKRQGLTIVFGTISNPNQHSLKTTPALYAGNTYHLDIEVTQSSFVVRVDGQITFEDYEYARHSLNENEPCYVGNPWTFAADVVVKNLKVTSNAMSFGANHFGDGILLKPNTGECDLSFIDVDADLPMLPCLAEKLELLLDEPRGIYNVGIRTCDRNGAGLDTKKMDSLYASVQGKQKGSTHYVSTDVHKLDHFVSTSLSVKSLGDLAASNVKGPTVSFYPKTHEVKSGKILGIRFQPISDEHPWNLPEYHIGGPNGLAGYGSGHIYIGGKKVLTYHTSNSHSLTRKIDGSVVVGFGLQLTIPKDTEITISSIEYAHPMDIYFISAGNSDRYSLPFVFAPSAPTKTWSAANDYCQSEYGTKLASIHSMDEMFLIQLFHSAVAPNNRYLIGLNDRKTENKFEWSDHTAVDFTYWHPGRPDDHAGNEDCGELVPWNMLLMGWNDFPCGNGGRRPLCNNPSWPRAQTRTFQLNSDVKIDEIISVAVGVSGNQEDSMCIETVAVDGDEAMHIPSDGWIGKDNKLAMAVFDYPICGTEITAVRFVKDDTNIGGNYQTAEALHLDCINQNRQTSFDCAVERTLTTTNVNAFSFAKEEGQSWARSSSLAFGEENGQETSTTNEFSWGLSQELTVGSEVEASAELFGTGGSTSFSIDFSIGANQQWTEATTETRSQILSKEWTSSQETGGDTSTTDETYFEQSDTKDFTCSATISVPPAHRQPVVLMLNRQNATFSTETDMKLHICPAWLKPGDDPYIVLKDIPGQIGKTETMSCTVQAQKAQYIDNVYTCAEEAQLAVSLGSTYIPQCQNDARFYQPCQCETIDTLTAAICYCVDKYGDMLDGKVDVVEKDDWQGTCSKLGCGGEIASKYWIVQGNDEHETYGKLVPQCMGPNTRNSNQNVGYGTSIGYHCCSMDGSKGDRAGCKTNGAYTYNEAVANCAAFGKRLCTREEVLANKGTGTGCNFDGFLVWTSTPCTDSSQWRKGVAGATCDETCGAIGMRCDSSTQSTIRSCEDIAAVASQVGESCVGCKNIRHKAYAGTPFISAKDGGCWFLTEGAQSVCDDNAIGHHEPLCYCVG